MVIRMPIASGFSAPSIIDGPLPMKISRPLPEKRAGAERKSPRISNRPPRLMLDVLDQEREAGRVEVDRDLDAVDDHLGRGPGRAWC